MTRTRMLVVAAAAAGVVVAEGNNFFEDLGGGRTRGRITGSLDVDARKVRQA